MTEPSRRTGPWQKPAISYAPRLAAAASPLRWRGTHGTSRMVDSRYRYQTGHLLVQNAGFCIDKHGLAVGQPHARSGRDVRRTGAPARVSQARARPGLPGS